jgi:hypothetical protein
MLRLLTRPITSLAVALSAMSATQQADAQDPNWPMQVAFALASYEATKDKCFYEEIVGNALQKMDDLYTSRYGSRWDALKQEAAGSPGAMQTMGTLLGSESQCKTAGLGIFGGLFPAIFVVGNDPALGMEIQRLEKGGGRSLSIHGETPVQQEAPSFSGATVARGGWRFFVAEEDWGQQCFSEAETGDYKLGFTGAPGQEVFVYAKGTVGGPASMTWQVDDKPAHELMMSLNDYFDWYDSGAIPPRLMTELAHGDELKVTANGSSATIALSGSSDSLRRFSQCIGNPALSVSVVAAMNNTSDVASLEEEDCVLEVEGSTYIGGKCTVSRYGLDAFMLEGNGYFAIVDGLNQGSAYWNASPGGTHAHDSLGEVKFSNGCWSNNRLRLCTRSDATKKY